MTSTRRPPSFMPATPWSQPGMTMPAPSGNVERLAAVPRVVELRAVLEQHARVLDLDGLAGLGLGAVALFDVLDDERRSARCALGACDLGLVTDACR